MKTIITYILSLFAFAPVFGQEIDLYDQALGRVCSSLESFFPENEIFIEKGLLTTRNLQPSSCSKQIFILDQAEIRKRARKQSKKKSFRFIRIVPMRMKDGKFYVTLIIFKAQANRKNLHLTNLHGENLILEYDCSDQSLNFTSK